MKVINSIPLHFVPGCFELIGLCILWICIHIPYMGSNSLPLKNAIPVIQIENLKVPEQISQSDTRLASQETLAVKNNNPLNIKARTNDPWLGQIGKDKFGHAVFATPDHGIRAASKILRTYALKHKITTIHKLVNRFSKANRNEYTKYLCNVLKVRKTDKINLIKRMPELLKAMSRFESGSAWPDELFLPYRVVAEL